MSYEIIDGVYKGPEAFEGQLNLYNTPITSLGCLKSVGGTLLLNNTPITSLGNLKSVGGYIWFSGSEYYTWKEYQKLIKEFKENIAYEDYPLYLNDERTPIRLLVNQKLKEGAL